MNCTRLISIDDAPELARLLVVNREFMAPWSPIRDESYYTDDGQRAVIAEPNYLKIAGHWQDHVLFQVLNPRD